MNKFFILVSILSSQAIYAFTSTQLHMGTFITINAPTTKVITKSFKVFQDLDKKLSSYKPESEVSQYNQNNNTPLSYETKQLIKISNQVSILTNNYFNIYHQGPNTLDFGAIAKGYAVDKVSKTWEDQNIQSGSISASGDIRCIYICRGGIEHPQSQNENIINFISKKPNLSLSTSGNAHRPGHLIDPHTSTSINNFQSLTLFGYKNNTLLDAITTAVSVMPKQKAFEVLRSLSNIGWIIVDQNGEIIKSQNINLFIDIF